MCGIVAILSDSESVGPAVERGVEALAHRGPDHQGYWIHPDGRVGLGHARLAIIDLEGGNQPISNETGDLHIVVAGEFYDFERIRRELEESGHRFATGSDSEIALHLYERDGVECLRHLGGEFAFIIWDERRRTLFAARDRFGIKPLYYARQGQTLWIGSEVKGLLGAGVPARWNQRAIYQNLYLSVDPEQTMVENVLQVEPAHFLVSTNGKETTTRYWLVDYPRAGARARMSDEEYAREIATRMDQAVCLRMRADVPVGCYLSGGLDSSYVLALATRHATRPLTAYTVTFAEGGYDEGGPAREVAEGLGVPLNEIVVTAPDVRDHFADAVFQAEGIHYNLHGVLRYLLARGVHQAGAKVVLAGEGADECFAGYAFCRAALQRGPSRGFFSRARDLMALAGRDTPEVRRLRQTSPWLARASKLPGFPPGWMKTMVDQMTLLDSVLAPSFLDRLAGTDPYRLAFGRIASLKELRGRARVHQILYLWLESVFPNYILGAERMDMGHAIEVRLPFLDGDVFDFVRQVPASVLAGGSLEKHLLRLAAKPLIGEGAARRPKQPFFVPFSGFRPGDALFSVAQDVLRSDIVATTPFLDPKAAVRLADQLAARHHESDTHADPVVIMMLSICILQERYGLAA